MPDPLKHTVALPLQTIYYPLGFAVEIATNDQRVLAAAGDSWRLFRKGFDVAPLRVHVAVGGEVSAGLPPAPVFRAQRHLLGIVADSDNFAVCDQAARFAFCWLSPTVAEQPAWMRYHFLEAIVYVALTHSHLTAVHAACVTKNGRGVLLSAPSGEGKTTLAYACARRGWTIVSDDVGFLVRHSAEPLVLGKPHSLRFLESAAELFSELKGREAIPDATGQRLIEVATAELGIPWAERCTADRVVFLRRVSEGAACLRPVHREEAAQRLLAELPRFEDHIHQEHLASLGVLLEGQPYALEYSDLTSAVGMLDSFAH